MKSQRVQLREREITLDDLNPCQVKGSFERNAVASGRCEPWWPWCVGDRSHRCTVAGSNSLPSTTPLRIWRRVAAASPPRESRIFCCVRASHVARCRSSAEFPRTSSQTAKWSRFGENSLSPLTLRAYSLAGRWVRFEILFAKLILAED